MFCVTSAGCKCFQVSQTTAYVRNKNDYNPCHLSLMIPFTRLISDSATNMMSKWQEDSKASLQSMLDSKEEVALDISLVGPSFVLPKYGVLEGYSIIPHCGLQYLYGASCIVTNSLQGFISSCYQYWRHNIKVPSQGTRHIERGSVENQEYRVTKKALL